MVCLKANCDSDRLNDKRHLIFVGLRQVLLDVGIEAVHVLVDHAQRLLEGLLEAAPDRHHLAHALHRAPDLTSHTHFNQSSTQFFIILNSGRL